MKKYLLIILLSVFASGCATRGYVEGTVFTKNNEHNVYGTVETYVEAWFKEQPRVFTFVQPRIFITDSSGPPARVRERYYVTSPDLEFAYINEFKAGVGYRVNRHLDARAMYWVVRNPMTGFEGDLNGIQLRYKW